MTDYLTARERPLGIILLSILHIVGGIGLAIGAVALTFMRTNAEMMDALRAMGLPLPLLIVGVGFLAILGIASAIGMWNGKVWGWYLATFWYVYAIVRSASALLAVFAFSTELAVEQSTAGSRGPGYYYTKFAGRILISALILLYFGKANVREYFGLVEIRMWKVIAMEFALCTGAAVALSAVAQLM